MFSISISFKANKSNKSNSNKSINSNNSKTSSNLNNLNSNQLNNTNIINPLKTFPLTLLNNTISPNHISQTQALKVNQNPNPTVQNHSISSIKKIKNGKKIYKLKSLKKNNKKYNNNKKNSLNVENHSQKNKSSKTIYQNNITLLLMHLILKDPFLDGLKDSILTLKKDSLKNFNKISNPKSIKKVKSLQVEWLVKFKID